MERIEKYAVRGQAAVYEDELVQTWIVPHLMILGEVSSGLSAEFRAAHPDEVWRQAARLRNVIVHQYFGVDPEVAQGLYRIEVRSGFAGYIKPAPLMRKPEDLLPVASISVIKQA